MDEVIQDKNCISTCQNSYQENLDVSHSSNKGRFQVGHFLVPLDFHISLKKMRATLH